MSPRRGTTPPEFWDLLNIGARFPCYRRASMAAKAVAAARGIPIMVRHHGSRPQLNDPTRINHYILPDGSTSYAKDERGWLIDVT